MLNRPYDVVLGMGRWCGVARNLRRYFRNAKAYPLDWWIVEWDAVTKLLEEDFSDLFLVENLVLDDGNENVSCTHYGVAHTHDFLRDQGGKIAADYQTQADLLKQKYRTLVERMDASAANADVLVVREWLRKSGEIEAPPTKELIEQRALTLMKLLSLRWPSARIDLLIIEDVQTMGPMQVGNGRIAFDSLENLVEADEWRSLAWDSLLQRQGVSIATRNRRLAVKALA